MENPERNHLGRISMSFYKKLIIIYCIKYGRYIPKEFKKFIINLNVLKKEDFELMSTRRYNEWKHYIDSAKQQLFNNQILVKANKGSIILNNNISINKPLNLSDC